MKNPMIRLREMYDFMGKTEHIVAEYLLENPRVVMDYNVRELAAKLYVSTSSIVRFCQRLGYTGYREFRQAIIYELAMYGQNNKLADTHITKDDSIESIAEKIEKKNIVSLEETYKLLDMEKLKECVNLIYTARTILLFGIGASHVVAKDAYLKFLRIGKACITNEDWHAQLLMAKNASKKDIGIVLSYSGETVEMVECTKALKENQTPTIAITRFAPSTIASMVPHVLYVSAGESVFRNGAISSRIAQMNVMDILYTAYAMLDYDKNLEYLQKTYIEKPNI